ncbi:unnamed protein product [Mytilus coruscus]|uniref:Uncharacterized protein n=1 Tax=Mytilus coruscus TaxID=42192 RepID=A0A6J8BJL5_MYTCO|nr:unnamed protein product [Mytilus coruscus]
MFGQKKHYSSQGDDDISRLHKAVKKEICIREATNANPIETDIISTALLVTGNQTQDEGQHGLKKVTTIKAYGASVYLSKGTVSTIVIAKRTVLRLAFEINNVTELELMAAVIKTRLSKDVIENIGITRPVFKSDSKKSSTMAYLIKTVKKFLKIVQKISPLTPSHLLHGSIISKTEMHIDIHNANIQELDTITENKLQCI